MSRRPVANTGCTAAFIAAAVLLAAVIPALTGCSSPPSASTRQGPVTGALEANGIQVFRGIPYAEPPVGELRFKPPRPPAKFDGTFAAKSFGPVAPQPVDELETASKYRQSEDCLTLNVWTPAADGGGRPVMFWIHGGGWMWGSGSDPWSNGALLARRKDVVVVTINYRLGALGFLYLDRAGGADFSGSGNAGLLDQVVALEWVRDNIRAFGGDPGNVTIFGESAGSMSVCSLMAMPKAAALFRRAIAESGALNTVRPPGYAAEVTADFMDYAGVADPQQLMFLTTEQILRAEEKLITMDIDADTVFGPVVDGRVFSEQPLRSIAGGSARGVDLMIGTNLDEVRYWSFYVPGLTEMPLGAVTTFMPTVKTALGDRAGEILESYGSRRLSADSGDLTMAIGTDALFRVPSIRVAEAQSGQERDTYMYLFTWPSPAKADIGSCHAIEIPFVFGTVSDPVAAQLIGGDPPERLVAIMQETWAGFARTGNPNNRTVPRWPRYRTITRATMVLDEKPRCVRDPYPEDRRVWDDLKFEGLTDRQAEGGGR